MNPTNRFVEDSHQELISAVRELCREYPDKYWRELDETRSYPEAFVQALTDAGYMATLIPEEYGGAGLGVTEASAILEEIHHSGGNAAACHAQMYIMGTLLRHGSEKHKREYLPKIADGSLRLQAFGVSEPNTGTDTTQMKTMAVKNGDRYVINGQKIWISRAEHSDLMLLIARTTPVDQVKKRTEGLSTILVDMRQAVGHGLRIRPIRTMMNHATTELFFDNLEVPAENLVGEEGQGFRYLLDSLNAERILIASECIGDARWFLERTCRYANERVVFGRPIGKNQGVQFPIARAYANLEAARLMVTRAASLFDGGKPCGPEANMAKLLAADVSWELANVAVQTYGGFGFAEEYDIERKFRETRLYQVAPISTNLILSYLAEHVLGLAQVVLMLPLEGITVVSLEQAVAAPFATRQLADLGARVIKVERPDGGDFARGYDEAVRGISSHFVWLNRSKESLTLDLKHADAKLVLHRLLEKADVFVQNLAPGATERLGFGTQVLRKKYPRLIVCDLSGYGSSGPYRDKKAYDMLVQAEAGLISITGTEETPCKVGISAADIACGMYAYSGILTALLVRSKTGQGVTLETSLLDALGEWMSYPAYYTFGGSAPQRSGPNHATIAPYGPVRSGDNQMVYIGLQNEREWKKFCELVLKRPELFADPRFDSNTRRVQNRAQLDLAMQEIFQNLTGAEIIARLETAQIANARMNTMQEFVEHPQLKARGRWREVGSPVGPLPALLPPVTMENVETVMNDVPALGQQTDAILGELGFDGETIAGWRREKMI